MRVLEQKPVTNLAMGKKKHKLRKHSKENANFPTDSSDEAHQGVAGPSCSHLNKSINLSTLRKAIKQLGSLGQCTSCSRESSMSRKGQEAPVCALLRSTSTEDIHLESPEPTLWVCLQCGHLGCDRNSKDKHALKHYQTPRSASHAVVVNTSTWVVWCYDCDDECPMESSRRLVECVELLRRLASGDLSQTTTVRKSSTSQRPEIPVTVAEVAGEPSVGRESDEKEKCKPHNRTKVPSPNQFSGIPLPKVYGLSNLGNTCFFNAVMQNLSHTYVLRDLLMEYGDRGLNICLMGSDSLSPASESDASDSCSSGDFSDEEKEERISIGALNVTLPECGALTKSMVSFLDDMKLGHDALRSSSNNIVNPGRLFGQICKKTPRFKGFQQQDSHELLRHLLEGMKNEEIKRSQSAILKAFNLENVNPKKVDEETKTKIKEYGRHVKHTFVDSVFGGYFISTVLCEECHMPSQIFEPFQDISLPILEDKPTRPNNIGTSRKKYEVDESKPKSPEQPLTGVDGFAACNRPSKHLSRKAKKQAKKEAKRKGKNQRALLLENDDDEKNTEESEKNLEETEKGAAEEEKKTVEKETTSSTQKEAYGSNDDWDSKSDADVEDNIESDVSRKLVRTSDTADGELPAVVMENAEPKAESQLLPEEHLQQDPLEDTSLPDNDSQVDTVRTTSAAHNPSDNTAPDCTPGNLDVVGTLEDGLQGLSLEASPKPPGSEEDIPVANGPVDFSSVNGLVDELQQGSQSPPVTPKSPKVKPICKKEVKRELMLKAMQTLSPRIVPASQECSVTSCLNQFTAGELLTASNKFGCERCTRRKYRDQKGEGRQETVYTNASKQLLIFIPPAVLTLHLKRFQQVGFSLRKVNRHVDFPVELDLAPYCSGLSLGLRSGQTSVRYSLYGVVEHSGRLNGGHYTAYVKVRQDSGDLKRFLQLQDINGLKLNQVLEMMKARSPYMSEKLKEEGKDSHEESVSPEPGKWYFMSDTRVSETSESNVLRCQAYLLFYERTY